MVIEFLIPVRTGQGQNDREHWAVRHRRVKNERQTAGMLCPRFRIPCIVTLTRHYRSNKLDDDNLAGSLKAIRDGICDRLGVDDGSDKVRFIYQQAKGQTGVRVRLEEPSEQRP